MQAAALHETLLHLLSLSPAHSAVRLTSCATLLLSVTLAAISLSPLHACLLICSLSSTGDIIHGTEGGKKRDLSLLLQRGCSMLQRLLQVGRRLKRAETMGACTHNINKTKHKNTCPLRSFVIEAI